MKSNDADPREQCSDPLIDWIDRTAGPWTVLAWAPVLMTVFVVNAAPTLTPGMWIATAGIAAAFCLAVTAATAAWARALPYAFYAALVVLTVLVISVTDGGWLPLLPLLAVAATVIVPARWAFGAAVAVSLSVIGTLSGPVLDGRLSSSLLWSSALTTLLCGIGNYLLLQLFATIADLRHTRHELANAAVADERLRFSRDLHDLLGHTLSVIVVKGEAIRRLAENDPAAASRHGADIETLGRTALAEVREAVSGYRAFRLADELDRATQSLTGAGIEPALDVPGRPGPADELLAWTVREAVTNVIRHSHASTCDIHADVDHAGYRSGIVVTDNGRATGRAGGGVRGAAMPDGVRGSGLRGLGERVGAAGGTMAAGPTSRGFRVAVALPDSAGAGAARRAAAGRS